MIERYYNQVMLLQSGVQKIAEDVSETIPDVKVTTHESGGTPFKHFQL